MKKVKMNTIEAVEYSIHNPNISVTKVAELFNTGRHTIAKYKKDDEYKKYTEVNMSDEDDEFLYYFSQEDMKNVKIYLNNPTIPYDALKKEYTGMPDRGTMYRWIAILGYEKNRGCCIKIPL